MNRLGQAAASSVRRALFYGAVGPPLGSLAFALAGFVQGLLDAPGSAVTALAAAPVMALFSYFFGGPPALVTGAISVAVRDRGAAVQLMSSAGTGFLATVFYWSLISPSSDWGHENPLLYYVPPGLLGAVAGAVCAALVMRLRAEDPEVKSPLPPQEAGLTGDVG